MSTIISTQDTRDAYQINDMAATFEGKSFREILNELGVKDVDGLNEYLITRIDTQAMMPEKQDLLAMQLDGFAGGLRALQQVLGRTLRIAALALERAQVGDADEAESLLDQVVTLDGNYVGPIKT